MADWAAIPCAIYRHWQPSQFCMNDCSFGTDLTYKNRCFGGIKKGFFFGRRHSLKHHGCQGTFNCFSIEQTKRDRVEGLLQMPLYNSEKTCFLHVLSFGTFGEEYSSRSKHTLRKNICSFKSCSKDSYSFRSKFFGSSNGSIWSCSNYNPSKGCRKFSGFQCCGGVADIGRVMALEWQPAVDELLLATSVALAYMAGIITPRSRDSQKKKNETVYQDDSSTNNSLLSWLVKEESQSDVDDVWRIVQQKLIVALDAVEDDSSYGTVVLEGKNSEIRHMLSLQAISKGPRLRLLQTALDHLHKEIDKVLESGNSLEQDDWNRLLFDILNLSIGPIYARWLEREQTLRNSVSSKEVINTLPDSFQRNDLILLRIKKSGKADLHADLLYFLCLGSRRTGSYCSYDLLVRHAVDILEDLVIALADGIATMYLELISVDNITLSESGLTNLVQPSYMATRSLERFRNEVALNRWLQDNFSSVIAIYEDRYNLWTLQYVFVKKPAETENYNHGWLKKVNPKKMVHKELLKDIVICKCVLQMKRTKALRALSGWRYYYSIFLEFSDVMGPLIRELLTRLGRGISFLLVSLIGRSLGLIYRGIRQSISWKS